MPTLYSDEFNQHSCVKPIHAHKHVSTHTYSHAYILTPHQKKHTYSVSQKAQLHTYICKHACTHAYHTHTKYTSRHTLKHPHIYLVDLRMHTYAHTHIHAHIYIYIYILYSSHTHQGLNFSIYFTRQQAGVDDTLTITRQTD